MKNDIYEKNNNSLNGFVNFINSKSGITRKKANAGKSKQVNSNQLLFEISSIALVVGWRPNAICSLLGNNLTVYGESKKLNSDEMNNLYFLIAEKYSSRKLNYILSGFDMTIMDGNSYSYFINWNEIKSEGRGGHTMPSGLNEIIDYCNKLIKN